MSRVRIGPTQIQNGVREFSTLFPVEFTNSQENLCHDVLVEPCLSRRWNRSILPGDPTRGVGHAAILFRKTRARQPVNRGLDGLLFLGCNSRRSPELTGLVLVDFAHDEPVGLL